MRFLHDKGKGHYLLLNLRAVAILPRDAVWGGRDEFPDARRLDADRRKARAKIEAWAKKHGYGGYEVYSAAVHGAYCVEVHDFGDDGAFAKRAD